LLKRGVLEVAADLVGGVPVLVLAAVGVVAAAADIKHTPLKPLILQVLFP
jgi:hypothetical protein